MKRKSNLVLILAIIMICRCMSALCEYSAGKEVIPGEEWSWSRGAYNTFSGQLDLEDCTGMEVSVQITTDLPYNEESEQQSMPVFTSVNGKRIVMTKQSDTVHFSPDSDNPAMNYTASFRLPEKQHVGSVCITFRIFDADGKDLKTLSGRIDSGEDGSGRNNNPFYIPADIHMITLIFSAAAVTVWAAVLIRAVRRKQKMRQGEH